MKKIILYIILLLNTILLVFLSIIILKDVKYKLSQQENEKILYEFAENNSKEIFSIHNIVYFSSANATSNINSNSSFNIVNLYQYTDIAIFINNHSSENYTLENTLKSVRISDIKFNVTPSIGCPFLVYKNIDKFATPEYSDNQIINDTLDFNISSEDIVDYSIPVLYNNCANPITLSFINNNIKNNYTLTESVTNISYDGSLLKKCNITLNSILCEISFLITIVNNLDETFTCPITIHIPLSSSNSSIFDGNLILKDKVNYRFIKQISI